MREKEADPRSEVPRGKWQFAISEVETNGRKGQLPLVEIAVEGGLKPGFIYEVVYEADHRPDWIDIPLRGVTAAARTLGAT